MKSKMIKIFAAIALIALAMSLAACTNGNIYDRLADDGYTVKVRFDASGAFVNNTQNVTIVEVFNKNDIVTNSAGKTGIALLAPEDPIRKDGVFKLSKTDGVNNYFQIGWYKERTPIVDANGNPLDSFGVLVSESGREQAYTYSGRWDFDKDVIDPASLEGGEMTLYAAWAPYFTYEFYSQNEEGVFEKIGSKQKIALEIPKENTKGEINMKDFPKVDGKVFAAAYFDEELTKEISANIDGRTLFVNAEKGIATTNVVKIYITWSQEQESVA